MVGIMMMLIWTKRSCVCFLICFLWEGKNPHFAFINTARKELNLSKGLLMFLCVQNKYNTTLNHSLSASLVRQAGDSILANSLRVSCCNQICPDFSSQGHYNRENKPCNSSSPFIKFCTECTIFVSQTTIHEGWWSVEMFMLKWISLVSAGLRLALFIYLKLPWCNSKWQTRDTGGFSVSHDVQKITILCLKNSGAFCQ